MKIKGKHIEIFKPLTSYVSLVLNMWSMLLDDMNNFVLFENSDLIDSRVDFS
jgi:hypothetical protein